MSLFYLSINALLIILRPKFHKGVVRVCYVLPELLKNFGITHLPAILIDDVLVLEGQLPTKRDVISWFNDISDENRVSPVYPHQTAWPHNFNDAVVWLINHMHESEKKEIAMADNDTLSIINSSWGQGIRNGFGL